MSLLDKILLFIKSVKFYGPIVTVLVAIILFSILKKVIDKASFKGKTEYDKKKRATIVLLFHNITKYVIVLICGVIILDIYGVNTASLVTGIGVAGVVIGLALQDALKDIIGGINIIMDNYFIVGDLVTIGDFTGYVEEFGLKSTKIKGLKGDMLIIANRNIDKVINLSQKRTFIYLNIPTAYEEDHVKVEKVLNGVLDKLKENEDVLKDDTKYLGVNDFGSSSISYLIHCNFN